MNKPINKSSDLQLAYQRLLALERFKSGFLARTSHELRSPINTIVSLSQLILEDLCEGPEEEKAFVAQSKEAALKTLALFDQIAAVSKLDIGREPPKLEAVDLSFLLPEVEMLTTLQAANQNVRYSVDAPIDELEIRTDAKWLKNILSSVIQDSIPYTKTMKLGVKQTGDSVSVFVESERTASDLQTELDNISDSSALPEDSEAPGSTLLSTGLVLATAHTALPLIGGVFTIDSAPGDHSQCRFNFPRLRSC